jgi:hypothetical protein
MANGARDNIVERLAAKLLPRVREGKPDQQKAQGTRPQIAERDATLADLAKARDVPEVIPFLGFRGGTVKQPGGSDYRMVYLDVGLQDWLLVEDGGIRDYADVEDKTVPGQTRQMLWVDVNAAVGRGHGPQSAEARFLTGEFTRAGDFEAPVAGGTADGARTGVFCEARTPTCCRYPSRPR